MKQQKYKILLLLLLLSIPLFGCSIKKNKEPQNLEETIIMMEETEDKLNKNLEKIQATEKEKQLFEDKLNENLENNIFSNDVVGQYIIINNDNTKFVKINLENIIENITTKDNYGSLWLHKNINNSKYGLYYSFIDNNDIEYLLENVPKVFTQTPTIETEINKSSFITMNPNIIEIYDIICKDEVGSSYYGYGFIYELSNEEKILIIAINENMEEYSYIDEIVETCFNIEEY